MVKSRRERADKRAVGQDGEERRANARAAALQRIRSSRAQLLQAARAGNVHSYLPKALQNEDSIAASSWAENMQRNECEGVLDALYDALHEVATPEEAASVVEAERMRVLDAASAYAHVNTAPLLHELPPEMRVLCPVCAHRWLHHLDDGSIACECAGLHLLPQQQPHAHEVTSVPDMSVDKPALLVLSDRLSILIESHSSSGCDARLAFYQLSGTGLLADCHACGLHKVVGS